MKTSLQPEFVFLLGIAVATLIMATVYFGLSRLLHEYIATFVLAVISSIQVLIKFGDRAASIK